MLTVLDLFSGIGGFSLGLERTGGFKTIAFCEIDPFCRKVLAKHWPGVPIYDDITTADFKPGYADVICGGFPCQDISTAGKRAGITGERSGLWQHMVGAVRVVRPRYAIVENVAALLGNGLDTVLGDLAAIGYDAEWHCIPASAIGAPHRRDRWWGVAYPSRVFEGRQEQRPERERVGAGGQPVTLADANGNEQHRRRGAVQMGWGRCAQEIGLNGDAGRIEWLSEPNVGRVAHGVPSRVDRLRSLGNAVVPQVVEIIGRAILASEKEGEK